MGGRRGESDNWGKRKKQREEGELKLAGFFFFFFQCI